MKQFEEETIDAVSVDELAGLVMDAVPLVMRILRSEMRSHRGPTLTVPQFRALGYVRRHPGCMLSDVSEHLGLTQPTTSKMFDKLEADGLVTRSAVASDRRKVALNLTEQGEHTVRAAAAPTRAHIGETLARLSPDERARLAASLRLLSDLFASNETK